MKMTPKTYHIVAKFWPLICGLIIGGMLGGIMQSISAFLLFGMIGWAYFYFDFFHVVAGTPCAKLSQDEEDALFDNLTEAMNRKSDEEFMASAGIEPYASGYGYRHH